MLCNGSARPGHPGQRRKWLAGFFVEGFHHTPLATDESAAWFPHSLCISESILHKGISKVKGYQ